MSECGNQTEEESLGEEEEDVDIVDSEDDDSSLGDPCQLLHNSILNNFSDAEHLDISSSHLTGKFALYLQICALVCCWSCNRGKFARGGHILGV